MQLVLGHADIRIQDGERQSKSPRRCSIIPEGNDSKRPAMS
ncbi:hypothetical protein EV383_2656 [Pseudonocardia sediminis]|uniref:Uncharacterized protein n=1 Tax=Pseudonocardia sediminis TaxID=1397368 RepID=A0A4Q7UVF0_PSEST|nr:hypothetical protein EV383_2656 [Pseudonocardia sediminis]